MDLHARIPVVAGASTFIARLNEDPLLDSSSRTEALLLRNDQPPQAGFGRPILRLGTAAPGEIAVPENLSYLSAGDIVRVNSGAGELRVIYRRNSHYNVLFFTERCNSRCLMCSQPPRDVDDGYLIDEMLEAIPLMSRETKELCITGGEPTLLGPRLLEVIQAVKDCLPDTSLHMLSNGRRFCYSQTARQIARIEHPDFMIGIPLYSDIASKHNFVVQAENAFDETVRGIMNLGRVGQKVEIRFVIHKQTFERMPQTARFIARNLPFVNHVVLMGLEMMGFTKSNLDALWVDPADYQLQLCEAVRELSEGRVPVKIYNHQLCLLDRSLWPFASRSISDWKNVYMPECEPCIRKDQCGGFFASAPLRYSERITPFTEPVLV